MPGRKFKAPPEMKKIPDRIAWALSESDLTQNELARRVGVSSSSLGARISIDGTAATVFVLMAKELGVRVGWLLVGEGQMREQSSTPRQVVTLEPEPAPQKEAKRPRGARD